MDSRTHTELTADGIAESVASFLAEQFDGDSRVEAVAGPLGGTRVVVFLKGSDVVTVDVQRAEVRPY